MEILAENRFTITRSLFYEGMLRVSRESYGKTARRAALLLGGVWLVLAAATLLLHQNPLYMVPELAVLGGAAVWLCAGVPRYHAGRAFRALKNSCGDDLARVTRFYEERLEVEAGDRRTVIPYAEVAQLLETRHLLVLVTGDRTGILLKRDGFTPSGAETVRKLLKK